MVCQKCGKEMNDYIVLCKAENYEVALLLCKSCLEEDSEHAAVRIFKREYPEHEYPDVGNAVLPGQIDMDGRVW